LLAIFQAGLNLADYEIDQEINANDAVKAHISRSSEARLTPSRNVTFPHGHTISRNGG